MKAENSLDHAIHELVRKHGILNVIRSVVGSCDGNADFAHSCNDKMLECYWRAAAVAIFDAFKSIRELPIKSKKY